MKRVKSLHQAQPIDRRLLLNQPQQQLAAWRPQFLDAQRAVVIRVGGVEALFDDRKILVAVQRAVLVGIGLLQHALGNSELGGFLGVQRPVVVHVRVVELGQRRDADFVPTQRAILVGIEGGNRRGRSARRILGPRQRRDGSGQEKSQHEYHRIPHWLTLLLGAAAFGCNSRAYRQ